MKKPGAIITNAMLAFSAAIGLGCATTSWNNSADEPFVLECDESTDRVIDRIFNYEGWWEVGNPEQNPAYERFANKDGDETVFVYHILQPSEELPVEALIDIMTYDSSVSQEAMERAERMHSTARIIPFLQSMMDGFKKTSAFWQSTLNIRFVADTSEEGKMILAEQGEEANLLRIGAVTREGGTWRAMAPGPTMKGSGYILLDGSVDWGSESNAITFQHEFGHGLGALQHAKLPKRRNDRYKSMTAMHEKGRASSIRDSVADMCAMSKIYGLRETEPSGNIR